MTGNILKSLEKFDSLELKLSKDGYNPFHKAKYITLTKILSIIKPALADCGLRFIALLKDDGILYRLIHIESGDYLEAFVKLPVTKVDSQAFGSAVTYFRRYILVTLLNLNVEDDDDGNASSDLPQNNTSNLPAKIQLDKKNEVEFARLLSGNFPQQIGSTLFNSKIDFYNAIVNNYALSPQQNELLTQTLNK